MDLRKIFIVFVSIYFEYIIAQTSECPRPELFKPCRCNLGYLSCMNTNITSTHLSNIFANLTKVLSKDNKHFKRFHMSEELVINELKENTFQDITFDVIEIMFNQNLTKIDKNTFNGTNDVTSDVSFAYNYGLTDLSIYEVLSKFNNASRIALYDNSITTIPTNALKNHNRLKQLVIGGNKMLKIEERAFENLSKLLRVDIFNTSISYIPEKAFLIANQSNDKDSKIYFGFPDNILLTGSSFADKCFSHCERSIELGLNTLSQDRKMGKITFLKESVFSYLLNHNDRNRLTVVGLPIDCNDCRNYWLTKITPNLFNHIGALQCSDGKNFKDASNFKNCPS